MAKVTSKGQVTVPKAVREALGLRPGDRLRFELGDGEVRLSKDGDLQALAASVPVPDEIRGASWDEISAAARRAWALDSERRARGAG